jgi:plastocyanin
MNSRLGKPFTGAVNAGRERPFVFCDLARAFALLLQFRMRKIFAFSVFLIACAIAGASCSQMAMPSSPSAIGSVTASGTHAARLTTRDDVPGVPPTDPSAPAPCVAPAPAAPAVPAAPARVVVRDDPPAPGVPVAPAAPPPPCATSVLTDIINIVSYFGSGAFNPNPITANVGDSIVFTNNDAVTHHIVLDDGTDLGIVAPGTSTAPTPLTTPTASFHCTIHPTMVGTINMPLPPDQSYMPPPDDYYGYY